MEEDAKLLTDAFANGFCLQYNGPRHFRDCKNLWSIKQNPTAAMQKVMREVELGRIAGPLQTYPFENLILSPIGLIPERDGSYRLIQHLSYPSGSGINEHIDPEICSVRYTSLDEVVNSILHLGPHCI